ncbi:MAG: Ig-like domain-containing protein, partial [Mariprofundaceae bacterium]
DGVLSITAKQVDTAGNVSPASDPLSITVDVTAPVATIGAPAANALLATTTPTVSGTAEIGAVVKVFDTDGTTLLGQVTADGLGNWSLSSTVLTQGAHTLTVNATDELGNISPTVTRVITVDTVAPNAPVVTFPAAAGTVNDNTPTLTGTAEAGATVTITDTDNTLLGTAIADAGGNWSLTTPQLAQGDHSLHLSQTDTAGNSSSVDLLSFTIASASGISSGALDIATGGIFGVDTVIPSAPTTGSTTGSTTQSSGTSPTATANTQTLNAAANAPTPTATTDNTLALNALLPGQTNNLPGSGQQGAETILNQALATPSAAGTTGTQQTGTQPAADAKPAQADTQQTGTQPAADAKPAQADTQATPPSSPAENFRIADSLSVDAGIPNQTLVMNQNTVEFSIPENAFSRAVDSNTITFKASLATDAPLPDYVIFNPATGQFTIDRDKAPDGKTDVAIKVQIVDSKGNVAETTFTVTVQNNGITGMNLPDIAPAGASNLSDQFISAANGHDAQGQAILDSLKELA